MFRVLAATEPEHALSWKPRRTTVDTGGMIESRVPSPSIVATMLLVTLSAACGSSASSEDEPPRRRSEAELSLEVIQKSAKDHFIKNGSFPMASVGLTPSETCGCNFGGSVRCPANPANWKGVAAWDALHFEMTKDHFYQYSYESDGHSYEARAVGDLDCDGQVVTYVLRGKIVNGRPVAELVKPTNPD